MASSAFIVATNADADVATNADADMSEKKRKWKGKTQKQNDSELHVMMVGVRRWRWPK